MRILVGCHQCQRQYDATSYPVGSRFRCHCGEILRVEQPEAHEALVVRCSGCGAPRCDGPRCDHCGSSFARFEQDLASICPHCATRVSDHARFCHSCGHAIAVDGSVGERSDKSCPACGGEQRMHSRAIGPDLSVLECSGCAGLWVGHKTFEHLVRRAEEMVAKFEPEKLEEQPRAKPGLGSVQYRPCPECETLMNRSQYGKYSRVVVDTCKSHGVWLDEGELTQILEWVRGGGLDRSRQRQHERNREELRYRSIAATGPAAHGGGTMGMGGGRDDMFSDSVLFRLFRF